MGRKTKPETTPVTISWSEELMTDICDHLTTGKSLIDIAALKGYPSSDSMYRQMAKDEAFATRIARAREAGQDHEADACVRMADQATMENHQVVKLRIWARQWRASKLAPKKFGDKLDLNNNHGVQDSLAELLARVDGKSRTIPS